MNNILKLTLLITFFFECALYSFAIDNNIKYDEFSIENDTISQKLIIKEYQENSINFSLETIFKNKHQMISIEGIAENTDSDLGAENFEDEITGITIFVSRYSFTDNSYNIDILISEKIGKVFIIYFNKKKNLFHTLLPMLLRKIQKDTINSNENIDSLKKKAIIKNKFINKAFGQNPKYLIECNIWYLTYYEIYYEMKTYDPAIKDTCRKSGFAELQIENNTYQYFKENKKNRKFEKINYKPNDDIPELFIEYKSIEKDEILSLYFDASDANSFEIRNYTRNNDCSINSFDGVLIIK